MTINLALHTQGTTNGNFFLLGSDENSGDVAELKLEDLPLPTSISTPIIADEELFLDRYIKQSTGASGKVAYVVFNGLSPGVFYNW